MLFLSKNKSLNKKESAAVKAEGVGLNKRYNTWRNLNKNIFFIEYYFSYTKIYDKYFQKITLCQNKRKHKKTFLLALQIDTC
jgi:hypothetical protein